jgi:hypothetical protein
LVVFLATVATSPASHIRPKGATPLQVPLVPLQKQCLAPNSTHGAPLSFSSCSPPRQATQFTTLGTPDANGAGAKSLGSFRLDVLTGDVRFMIALSDVRCLPATAVSVCDSANSADGPDYSGALSLATIFRVTDHGNGSSGDEPGTLTDLPLGNGIVPLSCQNTTDTTIGSSCAVTTTYNAVYPGAIVAGRRTVWELGQVIIADHGASGASSHPGEFFLGEGLFIP